MNSNKRVPVTVLTGFLGSGKTTLLNRLLTEQHGQKIAVIENEFGEIGIDHHLVIGAEEEIFEMNNGCICCTVRGDLIRILGNLLKRRDRFDRILIETTGMADPGPVAQTFLVDPEIARQTVLDGIITVVDAAHIRQHLDDGSDESRSQIAFADVIILNKIDAVPPDALSAVLDRVRGINAAAVVHQAVRCDVDLQALLDIGGFDLERVLRDRPDFLEAERGFEWLGVFDHDGSHKELPFSPGPDAKIGVALIPLTGTDEPEALATAAFLQRPTPYTAPQPLRPNPAPYEIPVTNAITVPIAAPAGRYVLATQHGPEEFAVDLAVWNMRLEQRFAANHTHDDRVGSVGIERLGAVDGKRFQAWMSSLLQTHGADIYRSKGVLHVAGYPARYVFHGVHMLMDGAAGAPWKPNEERRNMLVFIGRNLDREALHAGFTACLA